MASMWLKPFLADLSVDLFKMNSAFQHLERGESCLRLSLMQKRSAN